MPTITNKIKNFSDNQPPKKTLKSVIREDEEPAPTKPKPKKPRSLRIEETPVPMVIPVSLEHLLAEIGSLSATLNALADNVVTASVKVERVQEYAHRGVPINVKLAALPAPPNIGEEYDEHGIMPALMKSLEYAHSIATATNTNIEAVNDYLLALYERLSAKPISAGGASTRRIYVQP